MLSIVLSLSACNTIDALLFDSDIEISSETAKPGVVKFVAVGDTGHGNAEQSQVANAIKKKCDQAGCDFILLLGDNIYPAGVNSVEDEQFQSKFEQPYNAIDIPFYPVLGNHDYGADGAGLEVKKSFYQVQYTEKSSKWVMPKHFYRFIKADVTFIALDTNAQLFDVAEEQEELVPLWLDNVDSTWTIAYGHHPYLSNGRHGNAGSYDNLPFDVIANGKFVKRFADDIWCGKVDLYLAGHDHSRQWLESECKGTALVVSGAGSSTTALPGNNPVRFQSDTLGFFYVRIEGNTLTGEFVNSNGDTEFRHVISKQPTQ
jgi:predicted phosphodiesterase